jgi:hypothetical protein
VKKYFLDYNEKQIINAIVREDARDNARQSGFRKKSASAIQRAKDELDVGDASPEIRKAIVAKVYQSIAYSQAWELLGETYCGRRRFYEIRKQFCFLIADNMGMIDDKRRRRSGR